jgi:hypothetical protein
MEGITNLGALLAAGWIRLQGNECVITPDGLKAMRQGMAGRPGDTYSGRKSAKIDSVLVRSKPSITKKKKRKR